MTATATVREQRFLTSQLRSDQSAGKTFLSGYAARFIPVRSADLGGFVEQIDSHAFDRTLSAGGDIYCSINHDVNQLIGRKSNGTLEVSADRIGLFFRCQVADETQAGRDVIALVRRKDLFQCSFGFRCLLDKWDTETDNAGRKVQVRTLLDADVFDLGPVVTPAYPKGTSINIDAAERSLWPQGMPQEIRSRLFARPARKPEPIIADIYFHNLKRNGLCDELLSQYANQRNLGPEFRQACTRLLDERRNDEAPGPIPADEVQFRAAWRTWATRFL